MMQVVIPCGGEQTRWAGGGSKHLVDIDGVPLLTRTVGQFGECDILAWNDDIRTLYPHAYMPSCCRTLCESIANMKYDGGVVCVSLGDVFFTDEAVAKVLAAESLMAGEPLRFFGTSHEIFAMVADALYLKDMAERVSAQPDALGKCWNIYYLHAYGEAVLEEHDWGKADCFTQIDDGTCDFDTPEQYESFTRSRANANA